MKGEAYRESSLGGGEEEKKAVCMVRREVGVVEWGGGGGSRGLVGRSKHAQRKYASCTR